MNFSLAILALGFLYCCQSSDIESDLDDAKDAINKLAKLSSPQEYFNALTNLDDWGPRFVLATAMTIYTLTNDDVDWDEDEVSLSMRNKYLQLIEAVNSLEEKLPRLRDRIDLKSFPIALGSIGLEMKTMDEIVETIMENKGSREYSKDKFFMIYETDHVGVSDKLFTSMTSASDNIFSLAKQNLKNDKRATFEFVVATSVMLLHSLNIDTTYRLLKSSSEDEMEQILGDVFSVWLPKLTEIGNLIGQLDTDLTQAWKVQYELDVRFYLDAQTSKNSYYVATELKNLLKEKFYWRTWFVVVVPEDLKVTNYIEVNTCDGLSLMHYKGKHIFVSSADNEETFNKELAMQHLVKATDQIWFHYISSRKAQEINRKISASCSDFKMFGTYLKNDNAAVIGRNLQLKTSTREILTISKYFNSFIMG